MVTIYNYCSNKSVNKEHLLTCCVIPYYYPRIFKLQPKSVLILELFKILKLPLVSYSNIKYFCYLSYCIVSTLLFMSSLLQPNIY